MEKKETKTKNQTKTKLNLKNLDIELKNYSDSSYYHFRRPGLLVLYKTALDITCASTSVDLNEPPTRSEEIEYIALLNFRFKPKSEYSNITPNTQLITNNIFVTIPYEKSVYSAPDTVQRQIQENLMKMKIKQFNNDEIKDLIVNFKNHSSGNKICENCKHKEKFDRPYSTMDYDYSCKLRNEEESNDESYSYYYHLTYRNSTCDLWEEEENPENKYKKKYKKKYRNKISKMKEIGKTLKETVSKLNGILRID